MSFYVRVGPRGFIFRAGMILTGVMGTVTYWYASRQRPVELGASLLPDGPLAGQASIGLLGHSAIEA